MSPASHYSHCLPTIISDLRWKCAVKLLMDVGAPFSKELRGSPVKRMSVYFHG